MVYHVYLLCGFWGATSDPHTDLPGKCFLPAEPPLWLSNGDSLTGSFEALRGERCKHVFVLPSVITIYWLWGHFLF